MIVRRPVPTFALIACRPVGAGRFMCCFAGCGLGKQRRSCRRPPRRLATAVVLRNRTESDRMGSDRRYWQRRIIARLGLIRVGRDFTEIALNRSGPADRLAMESSFICLVSELYPFALAPGCHVTGRVRSKYGVLCLLVLLCSVPECLARVVRPQTVDICLRHGSLRRQQLGTFGWCKSDQKDVHGTGAIRQTEPDPR